MEYLAKIVSEQKLETSNLWKYDFLDIQTNQESYFYHSEPIAYNPNSIGKLNITTDKFFQSFEREVKDITERFGKAGSLVQIEGWLDKTIENTVNKFFNKKIKLSLLLTLDIYTTYTKWIMLESRWRPCMKNTNKLFIGELDQLLNHYKNEELNWKWKKMSLIFCILILTPITPKP